MSDIRRIRAEETAKYLKSLVRRVAAAAPVARQLSVEKSELETALQAAHRARAEVVAVYLAKLFAPIRRQIERIRVALMQARAMSELASLDDRMLADIGVRRSEIPGVVLGTNHEPDPRVSTQPGKTAAPNAASEPRKLAA